MSEPNRPSLIHTLHTALRGLAIVSPWLAHLLAADVALSLLLPISVIAPTSTYNIASAIARSVWLGVQRIFTQINGAKITRSGAELPQGESAIVVSNHVEWVDFYMIQALAIQARMLGRCRWFAKQQLRWVPFLGWGLWAMGMPLVSRNWTSDQKELNRVFHGVVKYQWPICIAHK
jgi:1-acyl-sn-glycerol-3-phosphate acyltransferase